MEKKSCDTEIVDPSRSRVWRLELMFMVLSAARIQAASIENEPHESYSAPLSK